MLPTFLSTTFITFIKLLGTRSLKTCRNLSKKDDVYFTAQKKDIYIYQILSERMKKQQVALLIVLIALIVFIALVSSKIIQLPPTLLAPNSLNEGCKQEPLDKCLAKCESDSIELLKLIDKQLKAHKIQCCAEAGGWWRGSYTRGVWCQTPSKEAESLYLSCVSRFFVGDPYGNAVKSWKACRDECHKRNCVGGSVE